MASKEKSDILSAQHRMNDSANRIDELQDLVVREEITRRTYEDEEQIASLQGRKAAREREEAVDRQTGRSIRLRTKFRRSVTKFLIG